MAPPRENALLSVRDVDKAYGGEHALIRVGFELGRGEIRALLGENGAGKSTLVKILAGVVTRDAGEILVEGRPMSHDCSSADVNRLGLAFVHQDLGLVDSLSVAENIALEIGYVHRRGLISHRGTEEAANRALAAVGSHVSASSLVEDLAPDERVMVSVARAFAAEARVIVLDEPTARLPAPDAARLVDSLARARESGVAFLYVTHRLDEVFAIADTFTVLRDGRTVADGRISDTDHDRLVAEIVGGSPDVGTKRAVPSQRPASLVVEGLLGGELSAPLDFTIGAGEILGISGLLGAGAAQVAALLGGAAKPIAGKATLGGVRLALGHPADLRRQRVSYVPGDRQGEGTIADFTVRENLFPDRPGVATGSAIVRRPRLESRIAGELIQRFGVRPKGSAERPIETLSGGNQQKVVFGRALRCSPQLLVLDSPTAGVDIGARAELCELMRAAADQGTAVLLCSTDYEEVAAEADRALVLARGHVVAELHRTELTAERLTHASYAKVAPAGAAKEEER